MKILALIPARGGSKRLPRKNVRPLGGKPLIQWTIEVATSISGICDILVSTDDYEIGLIARNAGAFVPWYRPSKLATDTASSVDVALHALTYYSKTISPVDGLLILQPTSPFRTTTTIKAGINKFLSNPEQSIIGVTPTSDHPFSSFKIKNGFLEPFNKKNDSRFQSQSLSPTYSINGSLYIVPSNFLLEKQSLYTPNTRPLIINDSRESLDIDTLEDWQLAEKFIMGINEY